MYQLIALDVDGTLLNDKKEITPGVKDAIEYALSHGKHVVISSGRGFAELDEIIKVLPNIRYFICVSGAVVYDGKTGEELYSNPLQPETILEILRRIEGRDLFLHLLSEQSIVDHKHGHNLQKYGMGVYQSMFDRVCTFVDDMADFYRTNPVPFPKFNIYHPSEEERQKTFDDVQNFDIAIKYAEAGSLEFSAKNVNKGTGLLKLCEHLNIPISEAIAVGDADNDTEILQMAGLSVAMGNASEHIKEIADVTTLDNEHDGVAHVIYEYLMKE